MPNLESCALVTTFFSACQEIWVGPEAGRRTQGPSLCQASKAGAPEGCTPLSSASLVSFP